MTRVQAIRMYFEMDGGRKITLQEMKNLSIEERKELGALCLAALGETLTAEN